MATISTLSTAVANATGVRRTRVHVQARALRDAKLITSEGRGFSASAMSPFDAARLLLAVMASDTVKDSVHIVESLSKLVGTPVEKPKWAKSKYVSEFERLAASDPTLLWAIVALLELAEIKHLIPTMTYNQGLHPHLFKPPSALVTLYGPVPAASITVVAGRFYAGYHFGALAGRKIDSSTVDEFYEREIIEPVFPKGYVVKHARTGLSTIEAIAAAIGGDRSGVLEREDQDD